MTSIIKQSLESKTFYKTRVRKMKKKIAVTFPLLSTFGGAEKICLDICKNLSRNSDVELLVYNSNFNENLEFHNSYKINKIKSQNRFIDFFCSKIIMCAQAYIISFLSTNSNKYDLVVSASGELKSPIPTLQLVHHPFFSLNPKHYLAIGRNWFDISYIFTRLLITFIIRVTLRINRNSLAKNITIGNSKWSKKRVYNEENTDFLYLTMF